MTNESNIVATDEKGVVYMKQENRNAPHVRYEAIYCKKSARGEAGVYICANECTVNLNDDGSISGFMIMYFGDDIKRQIFVKAMPRNYKAKVAEVQGTLNDNIEAVHTAFVDYDRPDSWNEALGTVYG